MKLILLAISSILLILSGCSKTEEKNDIPTAATQPPVISQTTSTNTYASELTTNFVNACTAASDGKQEYCNCLIQELPKHLSQEQYIAYEATFVKTGAMPEQLAKAISESLTSCSK